MHSSDLAFHLIRQEDSKKGTHDKSHNIADYYKITTVVQMIKRQTNNGNCKSLNMKQFGEDIKEKMSQMFLVRDFK